VKPSHNKLYGLISLMTFFWSINFVIAKIAMRAFPPLLIGPLRAVIAALLLLPLYAWHRRRRSAAESWDPRDLAWLAVLGVCGITLNQILFVVGLQRTSVAHAALVIATTPLQVLFLAALRGQERVTWRKAGGMLMAVGGIAVLNLGPGRGLHGATGLGDLTIFLGAFSFSLYSVFGKEAASRHDSLTVNTLGYSAGALAGAPVLYWQAGDFPFAAVPAGAWWALAYMALISSVCCYLIYSYALIYVPASRVAAFSYAQPVIAALTGWAVLREPITAAVAAGGLMVLSGVWLTGRG
jgi:drug/metabolite transporter (DMT)-like permease